MEYLFNRDISIDALNLNVLFIRIFVYPSDKKDETYFSRSVTKLIMIKNIFFLLYLNFLFSLRVFL